MIGAVFVVYRQIRFLSRNDTEAALDNAHRVVSLERRLHVFTERGLQGMAMHSDAVVAFLNRYYVFVHFPLTTVFLVWAYLRHEGSYRWIRNWFVSVTLAALVVHVAFPLAPPRMIRDAGFVDTLQQYGPSIYSADTTQSVANQFAAMPSLHFGWAVMVACAFIAITRSRRSLWALLHPAITLLAIVATANHYWIDAAVALLLVVVARPLVVARVRPRRSPRSSRGDRAHELLGDGEVPVDVGQVVGEARVRPGRRDGVPHAPIREEDPPGIDEQGVERPSRVARVGRQVGLEAVAAAGSQTVRSPGQARVAEDEVEAVCKRTAQSLDLAVTLFGEDVAQPRVSGRHAERVREQRAAHGQPVLVGHVDIEMLFHAVGQLGGHPVHTDRHSTPDALACCDDVG